MALLSRSLSVVSVNSKLFLIENKLKPDAVDNLIRIAFLISFIDAIQDKLTHNQTFFVANVVNLGSLIRLECLPSPLFVCQTIHCKCDL